MKHLVLCIVLLAIVSTLGAENVSNVVRWTSPSNGIAAARWPFKWKPPFVIATNTPAFEDYGLKLMIEKANEMREKWQLEIPQPLTIDDVYFAVFPKANGVEGSLMTRDQRFKWTFDRNVLFAFEDRKYFAPSFRYHDDKSAKLAKIKSRITTKEAEAIARAALQRLFGLTEKQLGMRGRVEVNQYKFEEDDGKVYPLPLFDVRWRMAGPKQYAAANVEYTPLHMEVSGITTNIANYSHSEYLNLNSPLPRSSLPTNYFQMLGLPENYLESIPAQKRALWGLPPLTNSSLFRTNATK